MKMIEKLWSIADAESEKTKSEFSFVFEPIGLILIRPLTKYNYDSTPNNSVTFAETGGDGVHFSLVLSGDKVSDNSPVVMTVPMNFGKENLIVGENLFDFLCLGEQLGFFLLEQLVYNNKIQTIEWLEHPKEFISNEYSSDPPESFQENVRLLKILREALGLKPWHNVMNRIDELQNRFMGMLEFHAETK